MRRQRQQPMNCFSLLPSSTTRSHHKPATVCWAVFYSVWRAFRRSGLDVPQVGTESNPVEIDIDTDDTSAGGQDKRKKKAVPKTKASRKGKRKAAPAGGCDREASGKRPARRAGGGNVGIAVRAVWIVAWTVETILVLSWRPPAANTPRRLRTCSILPPEEKCIRTLSLILTPSDPATTKEVHTNPNPNILTP